MTKGVNGTLDQTNKNNQTKTIKYVTILTYRQLFIDSLKWFVLKVNLFKLFNYINVVLNCICDQILNMFFQIVLYNNVIIQVMTLPYSLAKDVIVTLALVAKRIGCII